jgi:hypothetical protein
VHQGLGVVRTILGMNGVCVRRIPLFRKGKHSAAAP